MLLLFKFPFSCKISNNAIFDRVNISSTLQFNKGISSDLQKLLKYFNGTIIPTSVVLLLLLGVFPVIFTLDLNDLESVKLSL